MKLSRMLPAVKRHDGGAGRLAIVGRSGSGKTVLLSALVETHILRGGYTLTLDPLGTVQTPGHRVATPTLPSGRHRSIIYTPHPGEERWDEQLWQAYHAKRNLLIVVDELYSLDRIYRRAGNPVRALLTRGRSLGKGMIMATQRPHNIPLDVLAQANKVAQFDLPLDADRRRMAEIYGDTAVLDRGALGRYEYWYAAVGERPEKYKLVLE